MNKRSLIYLSALSLSAGLAISACQQNSPEPESAASPAPAASEEEQKLLASAQNFFKALPEPRPFEGDLVQLGKQLYYENDLSISGEMSCNTCHQLDKYGVDNEATSLGHDKKVRGERNSPTVYNAYFHLAQFWDGRAEDLVEQAKGPVLNAVEMGMPDEASVIAKLKKSKHYQSLFAKAFPEAKDPITFHNMAVAIAAFEETLATPGRWDEYLAGKMAALSAQEKRGLQSFINNGCTACHSGPGLGGNLYQKFGLIRGPYWDYTGSELKDEGRFAVTGKEMEKYWFKVPALRNVSETAPYFHDGSVAELDKAVEIMAITQLGRELEPEDVDNIVAFLKALKGEIPEHALQKAEEEPVAAL